MKIACLQKAHLRESQRINIRGYQVFRQDRTNRKLFSNFTHKYAASICHKKQPLNRMIKDLKQAILGAAKETTPR